MNRHWSWVMLVCMGMLGQVGFAQQPIVAPPTEAERDARLGWWREARFGMFVHWGVYSTLGGTWKGQEKKGYAEHIQRMLMIPIPVYRKEVAGVFNPTEFDADAWIHAAKDAGMGYFIITAKHHDGFAMYDSKVSDYNVMQATPWKHDPMKDLQAACKKYGVKFGFYYSHAFDWGEENGPGNDWDYQNPGGDKLLHGANWWEKYPEFLPKAKKYVDEKSIPQLQELIRNYDPDIIWFDTPHKLPPEENLRILAAVRAAKPSLVVNGRLVRGMGDYSSTADRPAEFAPCPGDWEGVPTTNESYAYNQNDHSHKPASHFIQLIAKASARGGNTLMNVGPMGNGKMDVKDLEILSGIGQWWKLNSESIRGTQRTPLTVQAWGESTRKGNTLYLHVFNWPTDGKLVVAGLKSEVKGATLLTDSQHAPLKVTRLNPLDLQIDLPVAAPDPTDTVIALTCEGEIATDPARLLVTNQPTDKLRVFDGAKNGSGLKFGAGKTQDAYVQGWTKPQFFMAWPVRLNEPAEYDVSVTFDAEKDGSEFTVSLGSTVLNGSTKHGNYKTVSLGSVKLEPGTFEIRVTGKKIVGEELMKLRNVTLKPRK